MTHAVRKTKGCENVSREAHQNQRIQMKKTFVRLHFAQVRENSASATSGSGQSLSLRTTMLRFLLVELFLWGGGGVSIEGHIVLQLESSGVKVSMLKARSDECSTERVTLQRKLSKCEMCKVRARS
jgi:hypothetical protein